MLDRLTDGGQAVAKRRTAGPGDSVVWYGTVQYWCRALGRPEPFDCTVPYSTRLPWPRLLLHW